MFVVGGIVLAVIFGLLAVFPQIWWRVSSGWASRNPDAVEPSDAYYLIQRIAASILAIAALVVGIALQVSTAAQDDRAARCTVVKKLAAGVEGGDADALTARLEKRGYSVENEDLSEDATFVKVSHGSDYIARVYWLDDTSEATVDCSS